MRGVATAIVAAEIGELALRIWPSLELAVFARGAGGLAALLAGCPLLRVSTGWMLATGQPAVVTAACSGTTYFLLLCLLLGWHRGARMGRFGGAIATTLGLAFPLAIGVNGVRVAAAVVALRWLNPLFPPSYGAFLHLLVGVAVFLPALMGLNLLCECYDRSRPTRAHR